MIPNYVKPYMTVVLMLISNQTLSQSVFNLLGADSLFCELESSEKPKCAEKSVSPWESLTVEKPRKEIIVLLISNNNNYFKN